MARGVKVTTFESEMEVCKQLYKEGKSLRGVGGGEMGKVEGRRGEGNWG